MSRTISITRGIGTRTISGDAADSFRERLTEAAFFMVALSFGIYLYTVVATISNIVERKSYEGKIKTVSGILSEKEAQYLNLASALSAEGTRLGFKETDPQAFVSRSSENVAYVRR